MPAVPDLFAEEAQAPAVRRPVLELAFGGDAALWRESLVSLRLETALAPAVDALELRLAVPARPAADGGLLGAAAGAAAGAIGGALGGGDEGGGGPGNAAPGDAGTLELGYSDEGTQPVFRGEIARVERTLDAQMAIVATNGSAALARLRRAESWEQQTAGDVVRALAAAAGVATGTVEDGIELAFYAANDRRGAWEEIAVLAALSGFRASITADGELAFVPLAEGSPVRTFRYAADLLEFALGETEPVAAGVRAVGEGAAGSAGADAWAWLVKDAAAVSAEAGETPQALLASGALRSADAVATAAEAAAAARAARRATGRALVPGAPDVVPGATIALAGVPRPGADGSYLVHRVCHRYTKRGGFTTRLEFQRLAPAGGAGGLLGAIAGALT